MTGAKVSKCVFVELNPGGSAQFIVEDQASLPELQNNGVLIQVKACGLSSWLHDRSNGCNDPGVTALCDILKKITNSSQKGHRLPGGQDIAGVVKGVGADVTTLIKGDHVVGIIPLDYGQTGCGDYVVLQEFDVVHMPERVSFVDAAGCVGDALRAYIALHHIGHLSGTDETVLVLGGASSLGSIVIQLAHHFGAHIITTCASQDEKAYLHSLGIPFLEVVEMNDESSSLKAACMRETGNLGVSLVVDTLPPYTSTSTSTQSSSVKENRKGEAVISPSKHDIICCMAVGSRWVTTHPNLQLDPPNSRLLYLRSASIGFLCEQAWLLSHGQQGRYQHILMDIMRNVSSGTIRPNVHHTVTFDGLLDTLHSLDQIRVGKVRYEDPKEEGEDQHFVCDHRSEQIDAILRAVARSNYNQDLKLKFNLGRRVASSGQEHKG